MGTRRVGKYPEAFHRMALERLKSCANVCALARELGVDRTVLYNWQRQAGEQGRRRPQRLRYESCAGRCGI